MTEYLIKYLIDSLQPEDIIKIMTKLGATQYQEKENYIIFPTICHNESEDEASMKLYYYKDNKIFMCYTECGGMNIFKFMEHYYETRGIKYNWYNDIYYFLKNYSSVSPELNFTATSYEPIRDKYLNPEMKDLEIYDESVLAVFEKYYPPEWLSDGISKEAMDKFGILYSISQNKIIIPHRNIKGQLVGIRGRALNKWEVDGAKYMPIKVEQTLYRHELSLNLYGLYENKENIRKNGIVFLFEGEKSVLQFESFSIPNCAVAVCGSNFNKFQLKLLLKECSPREIVICFDKEELPGESIYFEKLYSIGKKYLEQCNFSFIYDTKELLEMKDSPSDKGEEIFKQLYNRRVAVR